MRKAIGFVIIGIFIAVGATFVSAKVFGNTGKSSTAATVASINTGAASTNSQASKVFTLEELAKYNGENGAKAYVAVDGVVYDVTDAWGGANHHGAKAGTDVSELIKQSPHGKSVLSRVPIVGNLK